MTAKFCIRTILATVGFALGAASSAHAQVEQASIDSSAFSLGTLTPATGALSRDLWGDADSDTVSSLLTHAPTAYANPLHLELLRRLTLSPGDGPAGADNGLAGAKFLLAADAGFYRDAASLASLVPGLRSEPSLAKVVAIDELYQGQVDQACARGAGLRDGRTDPFWIKLRYICYVRAGEVSAAELTLDLLRRQRSLTDAELSLFSSFATGQAPAADTIPEGGLGYTVLREQSVLIDSPEQLEQVPASPLAAIARDERYAEDVREAALIKSMSMRIIDLREARSLLETIPTSALATDVLTVATLPAGSLEHFEAIGTVLSQSRGDWHGFVARSLLLSNELPGLEPVVNYSPGAGEIALAAMLTGQDAVVEKVLLAMSQETTDPMALTRAASLVEIYGLLNPGAARRVGSYLGATVVPETPSPLGVPVAIDGDELIALGDYVGYGLSSAQTGSEAAAALLYLMAQKVSAEDEQAAGVRASVADWAYARADLEWMSREAAFVAAAAGALALPENTDARAEAINSGFPLPRVKPAN